MSNPFENVPSSADAPQTIDKKTVTTLTDIVERLEKTADRKEAIVKNEEELAGVIFDTLLDDDSSIKDFTHSTEIRELIEETRKQQERAKAALTAVLRSVPTSVKAELSEEDRKRLDSNFKNWKDVFRLYIPTFGIIALAIGLILTGSLMLMNTASDTKRKYEQRISQLDRWYDDNAEAISFGQFYRENYPKQYRQWHNGQWQRDIVVRDSLRRAYSLDRLKRLYEAEKERLILQ